MPRIAILLVGIAVCGGVAAHLTASRRFAARVDRSIDRLRRRMDSSPSQTGRSEALPLLVQQYVERALPAGRAQRGVVRLRQAGSMWMSPGAKPIRYEAVQWIDPARCGFVWSAQFTVAHVFGISIVDRYADGRGLLEGRALGSIPIVKATGPGIDRSEAMRYLGELVWAPSAILENPALEWSDLGNRRVEVGLGRGGDRVSVQFQFDAGGDITGVRGLRPRRVGDDDVDTPWVGRFSDYREIDGHRIPLRGEVAWELESGTYTYWRGEVIDYAIYPAHQESSPADYSSSAAEVWTD